MPRVPDELNYYYIHGWVLCSVQCQSSLWPDLGLGWHPVWTVVGTNLQHLAWVTAASLSVLMHLLQCFSC